MFRHILILVIADVFGATKIDAAPAQVIIMRHAEKPPEGNELSLRGQERAAALVPFFLGDPMVLQYGPPVAIYAQGPKDITNTLRPVQTVDGLAQALMLPVLDRFVSGQAPDLARAVYNNRSYDGKMVLICVSKQEIPIIAKTLGATFAPDKWPDEAFDRLWIITFSPGGGIASFQDLPQRLLFGDSPN